MQKPISNEYLKTPALLFERYDKARPFRHLVLNDFPAIDVAWTTNETGEAGGKRTKVVSTARSCRSLIS